MAEMPNVIGGEVVSSDWGNDIRDRTVQRYAESTERSAEHPTPVDGDLSYLHSTDGVYVWNGSAWVVTVPADGITATHIAANAVGTTEIANEAVTAAKLPDDIMDSLMLVRSAVSEGPDTIPPTLTQLGTVNVNVSIPGSWGSWACSVHGHTVITQSADSTSTPTASLVFEVSIDGTANEFHTSQVRRHAFGGEFGEANSRLTVPLNAFRTGMSTTGVRGITLARSRGGLDNVYTMSNTVLVVTVHKLT